MARTAHVIDDLRSRVRNKVWNIVWHWREKAIVTAIAVSPTGAKGEALLKKVSDLNRDIEALELQRDQVYMELRGMGWRQNGSGRLYGPGTFFSWLPPELSEHTLQNDEFLAKTLTAAEYKAYRKQMDALENAMLAIDVSMTTKDPSLAKKIHALIKMLETKDREGDNR